MTLGYNEVVQVDVVQFPQGEPRRELGKLLFLTTDTTLDATGANKVKTYSSIRDLDDDFASTTEPHIAANRYFQQDPYPKDILIGRYVTTDVSTEIRGGAPGTLAQFQAISDGSFSIGRDPTANIVIAGGTHGILADLQAITAGSFSIGTENFTGIDLPGASDLAGAAALIQAAIRAGTSIGFGTSTVTYNTTDTRFELSYPPTTTNARYLAAHTSGTGVDLSTPLGLTSALATIRQGASNDFTGVNFSAASSYAEVAARIQASIRTGTTTGYNQASVAYSASPQRFIVGFPHTTTVTILAPNIAGAGSDISSISGLDSASGAVIVLGQAAETVVEALQSISDVDDSWHFLALEDQFNGSETMIAVSNYVATAGKMYAAETNEAQALVTGENTSYAAQLSAVTPERTWLTYSATQDYKAVSSAARLGSIDFDLPSSLITLNLRQLPGVLPDNLSTTQKNELARKRINYCERTPRRATPLFRGGWTLNPDTWIDVRFWLDWFQDALQVVGFNYLVQNERVNQTPADLFGMKVAYETICEQAVINGGLEPGGIVNTAVAQEIRQVTGRLDFDGVLPTGYLITVGSLANQSQSNFDQRISPAFRGWAVGTKAIHFASLRLTYV